MLNRMLVIGALVLACFAPATWAQEGCCGAAAAAKSQEAIANANAAIEHLQAITPDWAAKLTAEDKAALEKAQAGMAQSCPICKAMPGTMSWIGAALEASAINAGSCAGCGMDDKSGNEKNAAMAKFLASRAALSAKSRELFAAIGAAMKNTCGAKAEAAAPVTNDPKAAAAANADGKLLGAPVPAPAAGAATPAPAVAQVAAPDIKGLLARADEVAARFGEARKTLAALQGAEKDAVFGGLATMKTKHPFFMAWPAAVQALAGLLEDAVAMDTACKKMCDEKADPNMADACAQDATRAELTAKLLVVVKDLAAVATGDAAGAEKATKVQ
ncbi:MAG: hypothetical protein HYZ53_19775 [Planctomycetes bacterium]|nr:hypothetical protein [Planctomycetota bacterium]